MLERDDREPEEAEVRPEAERPEGGVVEAPAVGRLFSELGTGITTREVVVPAAEETETGLVETEVEEGAEPAPPVLTGRRKGGPKRRVVQAEPQPGVEGVALSG